MRTFRILLTLIAVCLCVLPGPPLAAQTPGDSVLLLLDNAQPGDSLTPAARLAPILTSLRTHKLVERVEWLPDANAVKLHGLDGSVVPLISGLPGVARVAPARAEIIEAAVQAQNRQRLAAQPRAVPLPARVSNASDPPVFNIHETWNLLQAKNVPAGQAVTAVLKDSGSATKDTLNVTADGNGKIEAGFAADVVQGDTVEISYGSTSFTIASDAITIDFDFDSDHIKGTAGANRTVYLNTHDQGIGWCQDHSYGSDGLVSAGGVFDFNLGGNYDVIRRTEVDIMSMDSNNNGWTVWRHAPWLMLRTVLNNANGQGNGLAPDEDVDVVLKSGATIKESQTLHTNSPDSSFGFGFGGSDMLPGDTFEVREDSTTWASIPIVTLSTRLNGRNITGQAPANQSVILRTDHYDRATGDWQINCQTVTADGAGNYQATTPTTLKGNDSVGTFYVDANGFEQQVWDVVPFLQPDKGTFNLRGSFKINFDGEMDITVNKKTGELKYQGQGYAFAGWFDQRLAAGGKPVVLAAGDTMTVRAKAGTLAAEGSTVLSGTVAKINLALDLTNNSVTGTAPKNSHVSVSPQKWSGSNFDCRDECGQNVATGTNGAFTFSFRNDLVPGDFAQVTYTDAKGNVTYQEAFSTTPTITINSFPATFRRGRPNAVNYTIANGMHVDDTFVLYDSVSRPDWQYTLQGGPEGNWKTGGPGNYTVNAWIAHQGKVYLRALARVDGRWVYTKPESVAKAR